MPYIGSHVWKVRQAYGNKLLLLPGALVIVERDDSSILLMRRVDTGKWSTISGYAEEGAGFRQTAITELREEAGITANEQDLIPFATLSDPAYMAGTYPNGDQVQVFAHGFVIRTWQHIPNAEIDKSEVHELKFFKLDEAPYDRMDKVTKFELELYRVYLQTGEFQSR